MSSQTGGILEVVQVDDDSFPVHVRRVCRRTAVGWLVLHGCLGHGRQLDRQMGITQLHVLLLQCLQLHVKSLELVLYTK